VLEIQFLDRLELEIEIPGFRSSNDDPVIFFPLAEEELLLSPSGFLFLIVLLFFLLLWLESDEDGISSDNMLCFKFLKPFLPPRIVWMLLLDAANKIEEAPRLLS
jgi:hypothetical protein